MKIRIMLSSIVAFAMSNALSAEAPAVPPHEDWDIVVYGGSSAGVAAAVQGARMKKRTVLLVEGAHVGGMSSGGLGLTDTGNARTIGGIADEFYHRVFEYYLDPQAWKFEKRADFVAWMPDHWGVDGQTTERTQRKYIFEPHVAEEVFDRMLQEAGVTVCLNQKLDLKDGVRRDGARIVSLTMESGQTFAGKEFIDATYEGDLLAKAGVKYIVGREANRQYAETLNGKFPKPPLLIKIDPYVVAGDASSGLLPPLSKGPTGLAGDADGLVQAYNFRLCLTDVPENRIPIEKPENYDPRNYELLARWIVSRGNKIVPGTSRIGTVALAGNNSNLGINFDRLPNHKTDSNDGSHFGSDLPGGSQDWPEATHAEREKLWQKHKDYLQGLLWFLGHEPRVPEPVRTEMLRWGLAKDEFADNGNWPYQLYVREARRMVSDYVMTEQDARNERIAEDPIALASYPLDSHSASYYADKEGRVWREPGFYVSGHKPFPISYRAICPRAEECANLLVTCCLSATHAAYGSIRMEPVLMMLGQAAGTASALAIDDRKPVQEISYERLRQRLLADGQILSFSEITTKNK